MNRHRTLWPEGGSEPLTSAPRSDFIAQLLFLSIDVCPGLGISPLRINIWLEFFSGRSWPQDLLRNVFFRGFRKVWNFLFGDLCSSWRAIQKSFGGYLWNSNFFWRSFHCQRSQLWNWELYSAQKNLEAVCRVLCSYCWGLDRTKTSVRNPQQ